MLSLIHILYGCNQATAFVEDKGKIIFIGSDKEALKYSGEQIDLTEQRVYVYRDGQLAYSCICVSGLPTEKNDRITRTGDVYKRQV